MRTHCFGSSPIIFHPPLRCFMNIRVHPPASVAIYLLLLACLLLTGCGNRTLRIDVVPSEERLKPETIEYGDASFLTPDKIAIIHLSGLLSNMKTTSML